MYSVYMLTDPRNGAIRYIGMSKNVWRRYAMHLLNPGQTSLTKDAWIEELRVIDLSPLLSILDSAETEEEAMLRETYWIQHYVKLNAPLLNVAKMGNGRVINENGMTTKEVAQKLHLSAETVKKKLQSGELPGHKVGRKWLISPSELMQHLEEQRTLREQKREVD